MPVPITEFKYKLVIAFPYGGDVNCPFIKGAKGYTAVDMGIYSEQAIEQ